MDTLSQIGSIASILGLILSIVIASQVIKIKIHIKNADSNKVKQKKNQVFGDNAGRDIKK